MEFTYLAVNDPAEWEQWAGRNFEVRSGGVALATQPRIQYADLGFDALDVAVDPDENVYALRPDGDVSKYDRGRDLTDRVFSNDGEESIEDPTALTVAGDRIYVADAASGDLVVVSEQLGSVAGRIDARFEDPIGVVGGDRKIYILDGGAEDDDGRIMTVSGRGTVDTVLRGIESPLDVSVDGSGNVYVLGREDGFVVSVYESRYVASPNAFPYRRTVEEFDVEGGEDALIPNSIEALSDRALVINGRLSTSGDPATYHYRFDGEGGGSFERRYGFDLLCSGLVAGVGAGSSRYPTYYAIGEEDGRVYAVEETKKHRENPESSLYSAQAFRRFDSGAVDTEWHRLTLDFEDLPSSGQVVVSYYASNADVQAADGVESIEGINEHDAADLRVAGIESVWDLLERDAGTIAEVVSGATEERAAGWLNAAVTILETEWEHKWRSVGVPDPHDALLEDATGRYLHVRIELVGDVDTSPRVGGFRAYCPRRTYLRHLPEIFRDGKHSAFLERYLSIFQSAFVDVEEDIENVTRYFDPEGVPTEYLSWLASWLAIDFDEQWPEGAKREFLVRAPSLFKMRGTREGMREILGLYLGHVEQPDTEWMLDWQKARIEQRADDGYLSESAADRELAAIDELATGRDGGHLLFLTEHADLDGIGSREAKREYTMHMHGSRSFNVFVGPFLHRDHRTAVERITASEKPAHADGSVVELRQQFKLEGNSFLGINSTLTPREFVLGRSTLGGDTVLKERGPFS